MSSNGYTLQVTTHTGTFSLRASWAAPFFAVDTSVCHNEGDAPLVYHASSFQDARRFGGKIFNSKFVEVSTETLAVAA